MLPLFAKLVPAGAFASKCRFVGLFLWRFVTQIASDAESWCFLPQASRANHLLAFLRLPRRTLAHDGWHERCNDVEGTRF